MAFTNEHLTDERLQAEREEITQIIESNPELFLAKAEEHPTGKRILDTIRKDEAIESSQPASESNRDVTLSEALEALEGLENSQYTRNLKEFNKGSNETGYVSGNIPMIMMVKLIEFARQQITRNNPELYVLQDTRGTADNQLLFWSKDARSYTTDLDKAHRFTKAEAEAQNASRATDLPHRVGDLKPATQDILDQAARQIARAKQHQGPTSRSGDPAAIPKPKRPEVGKIGTTKRSAALYAIFANKTHSDDAVVMVADKGTPDTLDTVLISPDEWQIDSFRKNKDNLIETTTLADFAARFWEIPNAHSAMTYNSWLQFIELAGPEIKEYPELFDETMPNCLASNLPPDLPPRVAHQRMALLDAFPTPENLRTKIQLADIDMASLYGEPVNEHLFAPEQMVPTWQTRMAKHDLDDLMTNVGDNLKLAAKNMADEITTLTRQNQAVPEALIYSHALTCQTIDECDLMIESITTRIHRESMRVERAAGATEATNLDDCDDLDLDLELDSDDDHAISMRN